MITLKFASYSQEVSELEEQLKAFSLAFKLEEDKTLGQLILEDGERVVEGKKAISAHLDELGEELRKWWYCDC